jgi:hypothetical protein
LPWTTGAVFEKVPRMKTTVSQRIAIVALGCALCCAGCKSWNWLGNGFDDELAGTGSKLRPAAKNDGSRQMGLSAKSREIESDLGVR